MKPFLLALAGLLLVAHGSAQTLTQLRNTGPRANRVNIIFVSEGYTAAEQSVFEQQVAARIPGMLADESWRRFADHVNIFQLFVPSQQSGFDIPDENIFVNTAFDAFRSTNVNNYGHSRAKLDEVLMTHLPDYDIAVLFVNAPVGRAGIAYASGSQIGQWVYNGPTVDQEGATQTLLHELGHAFAGLADEYNADQAYPGDLSGVRAINASGATTREGVPWNRFIFPETPVLTTTAPDETTIGVFMGARYYNNLTRPSFNSKMRSAGRPWNTVSVRAFADAFHRLNLNGATAAPTITQQPSGVTVARGTGVTLSVQATGVGPLTYHWRKNGVYLPAIEPTLRIPAVTEANVGLYSVEVSNGAGSTFSASVPVALTSDGTRTPQTVTIEPIADRTFGAPPFSVSASASSGLPVTLRVVGGLATLSGNMLTLTGPSTVTISAEQAGNATYAPATALRTFTVNKVPATIVHNDLSHTYDGHPKVVTVSISPPVRSQTTYAPLGSTNGSLVPPSDPGIYTVVTTIDDVVYAGSRTDTMVIYGRLGSSAPTLATPLPRLTATVGVPFNLQLSTSGAVTNWAVSELPPGLQLNAATGVISGTPTGTFALRSVAVMASGSGGVQVQPMEVQVVSTPPPAPTIAAVQSARGPLNVAFRYQITATGATSYQLAAGSTLPAGLTLDAATGVVSGTPTAATIADGLVATIQVSNGVATASGLLVVRIDAPVVPPPPPPPPSTPPAPIIASQSVSSWANVAVNYQVQATGAASFALAGTAALPAGLSLSSGGAITGTSTVGGTWTVTVRASGAGGTAEAPVTIALTPPPAITSSVTASVTAGAAFNYGIAASNTPTAFGATGLPAGLSVNAVTGAISGTVTSAGTYPIELRATNPAGTGGATLTLTVSAAPVVTPPPAVTPPPVVTPPPPPPPPVVTPPPPPPPPFTPPPPPPPVAKQPQTIEFVAPVSAPVMGQPFALGATSSAGLPITYSVVSGPGRIEGSALIATGPGPIVVRAMQPGTATIAAASAEATISGAVKAAQTITFAAPAARLATDAPFALEATASSGLPVTFSVVSGPATVAGRTLTLTGAGTVVVRATQAGTDLIAPAETTVSFAVAAPPSSRFANISSRLHVSDGDPNRAFIMGFVLAGDGPQRVLVRAAGPALAGFGLAGALPDPRLRLFDATGRVVADNDNWAAGDAAALGAQLGAFAFREGSADAAVVVTLAPGAYSAHALANGGAGVALIEVYDANPGAAPGARSPLINLSTRGHVGAGDEVMAAGFVITGDVPKRVLVRAIGPGLAAFGVGGTIGDPSVAVHQGEAVLARNDNWETPTGNGAAAADVAAAARAVGAFGLLPGSKDAALILVLNPGGYSAVVRSADGSAGVGLVEVYELP